MRRMPPPKIKATIRATMSPVSPTGTPKAACKLPAIAELWVRLPMPKAAIAAKKA